MAAPAPEKSAQVSSSSPLFWFIQRNAQNRLPSSSSGSNISLSHLAKSVFPKHTYNEAESSQIASHVALFDSWDGSPKSLESLNAHLSTRTTILGTKPSPADLAVYAALAPDVKQWLPEQRTSENGYHHICRLVDYVENGEGEDGPLFGVTVPESEKVHIDVDDVRAPIKPIDPKAEKEKRKKEREASAAAGSAEVETTLPVGSGRKAKKEAKQAAKQTQDQPQVGATQGGNADQNPKPKKDKPPKQPKNAPPPERPLSPSLIDLRVGHILQAINHPNADSLYVSTIAVGDPPDADNTSKYTHSDGKEYIVRTVCSGLNGLVPLQSMQDRKVVAVCNLKPVTMRGVKSCAMVLAASPLHSEGGDGGGHGGPLELVNPPSGAEAGSRCWFEGYEQPEPEGQLNPKKKIWETCQPGFITTDDGVVGFEEAKVEALKGTEEVKDIGQLRTKDGICTVANVKGGTVR